MQGINNGLVLNHCLQKFTKAAINNIIIDIIPVIAEKEIISIFCIPPFFWNFPLYIYDRFIVCFFKNIN